MVKIIVSTSRRGGVVIIRGLGGNGSATDRTIGVRFQPHVDARSMERVFTRAQLPNHFAISERRQANGTLGAHVLNMGLLPILEPRCHLRAFVRFRHDAVFRTVAFPGASAAEAPLPPAERRRGAFDGEEESVNQGGDGDDG